MPDLPFFSQTRSSMGAGSSGDTSHIGPEQGINGTQGGAPGGDFFGSDNPVRDIHGPKPFSEGFSPNNSNPELPRPGSNDGVGLPPNGMRR